VVNLFDPFSAEDPRPAGQVLAEMCADKAEAEGWDRDGATRFVLGYLAEHGPTSGEVLVAAASKSYRPHDGRAYGAILGGLSRRGFIRKAGMGKRVLKGHGADGAVIWALAEVT
jgi:hypothetical protein